MFYPLATIKPHLQELRRRTLISFIVWFVGASVYYGLIFSGGNIRASPFLLVAASGLVELPSIGLAIFCLDRC